MADTGQELIKAALASVDGRVQQQIEAARQRRARQAQQRAELNAARAAGIGRRNAQRLRNLANRGDIPTVADLRGPDGNATMAQSTTVQPSRGDTPTTVAQTATVARSPKDPANERGPARTPVETDSLSASNDVGRPELRSRYIPRAREASVKEARDGRE